MTNKPAPISTDPNPTTTTSSPTSSAPPPPSDPHENQAVVIYRTGGEAEELRDAYRRASADDYAARQNSSPETPSN